MGVWISIRARKISSQWLETLNAFTGAGSKSALPTSWIVPTPVGGVENIRIFYNED